MIVMKKYIFLYKENTDDRDCCAYIESKPMRWECGHYFGGVILHGACYSKHDFADYKDIKTVLTEKEYSQLIRFNEELNTLGCGIKEGSEKYNKGVELCRSVQHIYDKLLSSENQELFDEIQTEEIEYLMNEYNLDKNDIEKIFNEYLIDYRDRSIIGCIFNDAYDCDYEEAISLGYINYNSNDIIERYFNFEQFGEDLLEEEQYCQLDDSRIVYLNY